ncbi:MAG: hypothetical protein KAV45_02485 [Calditrichia bacterium]|jgi:hypothetical protein|nr:hypothetical protein [Calditrichia bacterium]
MKNILKVQDFIKLIKNIEKLYFDNWGCNTDLLQFLIKFRHLLEPYKNFSGDEFLELFEKFISNQMIKKEKRPILNDINIEKISFIELRKMLDCNSLSKEELLEIGDKKFSISKGANKRLNKDQLIELIESAMKNIETLKVIKNKAAE